MRRKIFKKSNESRIRHHFSLVPYYWRLRSAHNDYENGVGWVNDFGQIFYNYYASSFIFILPVCSI